MFIKQFRIVYGLRAIMKTEGDNAERIEIEPLRDRKMSTQSPFEITAKPVVAFTKVGIVRLTIKDNDPRGRYMCGRAIKRIFLAFTVNRLIIGNPRPDVRNLVCGKSKIKSLKLLVAHRRARPVCSFEYGK